MKVIFITLLALLCAQLLFSQPWEVDLSVFNPSGIPSLTFSQPRFADLDADGDKDFFLGSSNDAPLYIKNTGTANAPVFTVGPNIAPGIPYLAAEMAVCADLDADGDLDIVTGGYTGLHLFQNTGTTAEPVFSEVAGIFSGLSVGSNPVPDLADVDSDGDLDLVVGLSEDGAVRLYTNVGSATIAQYNEANVQTIGDIGLYAYPVFCDFDSDADIDILCGRDSHGFIYYQNNGSATIPNWQPNTTSFAGLGMTDYWNSPDLVDLNSDGLYELVFGTASGPLQYYTNTGTSTTPVWQQNTTLFGGVIDVGGASSPVFCDWDSDGDLDLISGSQLGDIKFYRNTGSTYAPAWQADHAYFASIDHSIYAAVAIGDVNGDGLPDAIVGDLSGQLFYHRNNGIGFVYEPFMFSTVALGGWSVPRLLDKDGDGDLDLVAGNEAGNLFYYDNQGTATVPNWQLVNAYFGTIDVGTNCSPSFADIDYDGDWDFLAGDMWGDLNCYVWQGLGWAENTTLFAGITTDQNAAPALVDLDHDGDLDLVLGDYDGTLKFYRNLMYSASVLNPPINPFATPGANVMVTWDTPAPGSTSPFEHYKLYLDGALIGSTTESYWFFTELTLGQSYTVWITAQYIAGESVPAEIQITPTGNSDDVQMPVKLSNCPNPFNPSTTISFSIPIGQQGTLEIINLKGQIVKTWNSLSAGEHSQLWDGKDSQGQPVASGVYLYRLNACGQTQTRKMMLMK